MRLFLSNLALLTVIFSFGEVNGFLPVVLWHGMGDTCCFPFSMGRIKSMIEEAHNGTYVYSIMVGDNIIEDELNGYFKNVNDQVEEVCTKIQADPLLANGYHAVGFSQGGQFLRALQQRCPNPPIHNLVSLGGQQQGVFGFPNCDPSSSTYCEDVSMLLSIGAYTPRALAQKCPTPKMSNLVTLGGQHQGVFGVPPCSPNHRVCEYMRKMLHFAAYSRYVQERLVQAEYWHDPLNETLYREASVFLAEINQENVVNEDYRANLLSLENLVLVMFTQDSMVIPRESSWFGFYVPGQDVQLQTLQESELYTEDKLGLKQMDEEGRLHFLTTEGDHLQFTDEWFLDNILGPYLT